MKKSQISFIIEKKKNKQKKHKYTYFRYVLKKAAYYYLVYLIMISLTFIITLNFIEDFIF